MMMTAVFNFVFTTPARALAIFLALGLSHPVAADDTLQLGTMAKPIGRSGAENKARRTDMCLKKLKISLTGGLRQLYCRQLASSANIYAHHFDVPSICTSRPDKHKYQHHF